VLSDLLGINANSIGQAIAKTRQLLNEYRLFVMKRGEPVTTRSSA
jgi:hypothetical protein